MSMFDWKDILLVKESGTMSSLQKLNFHGRMIEGFSQGGPLDELSFFYAVQLLYGCLSDNVVEMFYGGVRFESLCSAVISVTGAHRMFLLNQLEVPSWKIVKIKAQDDIFFPYQKHGLITYLAINGKIRIKGESSNILMRPLKKGDLIQFGAQNKKLIGESRWVDLAQMKWFSDIKRCQLRFVAFPCLDPVFQKEKERFCQEEFEISRDMSRSGYRLEGAIFNFPRLSSSLPLLDGSIQVPSSGSPIVLLKDRQTVGGYPLLGVIIPSDLRKFVQLCPGTRVSFRCISIEEAELVYSKDFIYQWLGK